MLGKFCILICMVNNKGIDLCENSSSVQLRLVHFTQVTHVFYINLKYLYRIWPPKMSRCKGLSFGKPDPAKLPTSD